MCARPRHERSVDLGLKLEGYFQIESVRHYLIIGISKPAIIHHQRLDDGSITTRIILDGAVTLDPPGISLRDLFAWG